MSLVGFRCRNHPQQRRNPKVDNRATPPEVFCPLNEEWGFTVDVAADSRNKKCERYYSEEDDGLSQSWAGEVVWCNPPWSNIEPWVRKAMEEVAAQVVVLLLPANRCEQGWWQDHIEPVRDQQDGVVTTRFIRGRTRYINADDDAVRPNARPPCGSVLVIVDRRDG
jgi:phage N-6-adenine-methyltransferase